MGQQTLHQDKPQRAGDDCKHHEASQQALEKLQSDYQTLMKDYGALKAKDDWSNKIIVSLEKTADALLAPLGKNLDLSGDGVKVVDGKANWVANTEVTAADDKVTKIEYPNGKTREFKYENGKICEYKAEDGATWKTKDGLHWERPDTGTKMTGIMHADAHNGAFSFLNLDPRKKGEQPHLTLASADGEKLDKTGAVFEQYLGDMMNNAFDRLPLGLLGDKLPRGWFTEKVNRNQLIEAMTDHNRSADERISAGLLFEFMKRDPNCSEVGRGDIDKAKQNVNFKSLLEMIKWFDASQQLGQPTDAKKVGKAP